MLLLWVSVVSIGAVDCYQGAGYCYSWLESPLRMTVQVRGYFGVKEQKAKGQLTANRSFGYRQLSMCPALQMSKISRDLRAHVYACWSCCCAHRVLGWVQQRRMDMAELLGV